MIIIIAQPEYTLSIINLTVLVARYAIVFAHNFAFSIAILYILGTLTLPSTYLPISACRVLSTAGVVLGIHSIGKRR
jgi:hypothetical protein